MLKTVYETIKVEPAESGILVISLNRPEHMNAITVKMFEEIAGVLTCLKRDLATRVVIIRGEGEKGFCCGLDFQGVITPEIVQNVPALYDLQCLYSQIIHDLRAIPQPVIAAVHGAAAGAGFCLTLAADIRVISQDAKFCNASIKAGVTGADMGNTFFLPRLIGAGRASDLLLTGRFMYAQEAVELGLVSACVERENLMEKAFEMAGMIAGFEPLAVRLTKEAIQSSLEGVGLETILQMENRNQQVITAHNMTRQRRKAARSAEG